jgi:hypothetical protein
MLEKIKAMFTNIGNIQRPREAERSDTRQEIRRHEPDQERNKKDDGSENKKESFNIGDSAAVSVDALRLFLENFLASLEQNAGQRTSEIRAQNPQTGNLSPAHIQEHTPTQGSGPAAQAASVYRHVGNAGRPTSILEAGAVTGGTSLPATEIRTIHALLNDLRTLSERNIQLLQIERGESFLQSLVVAVDKAKTDL